MDVKSIVSLLVIALWALFLTGFMFFNSSFSNLSDLFDDETLDTLEPIKSLLAEVEISNFTKEQKYHYAIIGKPKNNESGVHIIEFFKYEYQTDKLINLHKKEVGDIKLDSPALTFETKDDTRYKILNEMSFINNNRRQYTYIDMSITDWKNGLEHFLIEMGLSTTQALNRTKMINFCIGIFLILLVLILNSLVEVKNGIVETTFLKGTKFRTIIILISIICMTLLGINQSLITALMGGILVCPLGLAVTTIVPILAILAIRWSKEIYKGYSGIWRALLIIACWMPLASYAIGHVLAEISINGNVVTQNFVSHLTGRSNYYITIFVGILGLIPFTMDDNNGNSVKVHKQIFQLD